MAKYKVHLGIHIDKQRASGIDFQASRLPVAEHHGTDCNVMAFAGLQADVDTRCLERHASIRWRYFQT
jgi:hypothetical protein